MEVKRMSSDESKRGKMSVAEAGRKGGMRTSETHGEEFYSEIGSKGGSKRAMQHEGSPEAEGKTSLEEAGHRGGQRVRKLIQEGKEHENE
jgi:general stress protein YciG